MAEPGDSGQQPGHLDSTHMTAAQLVKHVNALVKERGVIRTKFTSARKEFEACTAAVPVVAKRKEARIAFALASTAYGQLHALNEKIMPLLADRDEKEYNEAWERVNAYEREWLMMTETYRDLQLTEEWEITSGLPQRHFESEASILPAPGRHWKLPRFNGDFKKFREWWQQYKVHVHDKNISPIEKFTLLKDSLGQGPAADIEHLEFSALQYPEAIRTIEKRYGRVRDAEKEHVFEIQKLYAAKELHVDDKFFIFVSKLSQNVRALISLGKSFDSLSTTITPGILGRLPTAMRENFTRTCLRGRSSSNALESELKLLIDFLEEEVEIKRDSKPISAFGESSSSNANNSSNTNKGKDSFKGAKSKHFGSKPWKNGGEAGKGSAGFLAKSSEVDHSCIFCSGSKHESKACRKNLTLEERKELIEKNNACFKCLRRNHFAKKCRTKNVKCEKCSKSHYAIMCPTDKQCGDTSESLSTQVLSSAGRERTATFFQTGFAWINSPSSRKVFRFLLDTGAERSYISRFAVDALSLKPSSSEMLALSTIGGEVSNYKKFSVFDVGLQSRFDRTQAIRLKAIGIPEIAKGDFPVMEDEWGVFPLADHAKSVERRTVDILIGQDALASLQRGEERVFEDRVVATNTILGWVMSGRGRPGGGKGPEASILVTANLFQPGVRFPAPRVTCMTAFASSMTDPENSRSPSEIAVDSEKVKREFESKKSKAELDADLQKVWSTDLLGIEDPRQEAGNAADEDLRKFYENNIERLESGKYQVSLPFRSEKIRYLGDNENVARGSLNSFINRAKRKPGLLASVDAEMENFVSRGYAELATPKKPGELVHYLPLLPVVKGSQADGSFKVRVVKDGGARRRDEASLNDCLHVGANLLPCIIKVLLRFRRDEIAIVSDIQQAFLQYKIHPDHRTFLRFFWRPGISRNPQAPLKEYWSTVLDFGIASSPFIHCAGIRYHIQQLTQKYSDKADLLRDIEQHYYMDDLVTTVNDTDTGWQNFDFMFKAFNEGGFKLRKWATNSSELGQRIRGTLQDSDFIVTFDQPNSKFLGVGWNQISDSLNVPVESAIEILSTSKKTKRSLLKATASIYDVLGFISPITIKFRILLQSLWKQKIPWDTELVGENAHTFTDTIDSLKTAREIRIPRRINTSVRDVTRELHVFCDSSLSALGCVVYIREVSMRNDVRIYFILSKARVVPLKSGYSIHKLELVGAVLAARMASKVKEYLNFHFESTNYWCDNSPTLHWINDSPDRLKAFVSNRVKEIQSSTSPSEWSWVASEDNPADLLSRGASLDSPEIRNKWFSGPSWLHFPGRPTEEHSLNEFFDRGEYEESIKKTAALVVSDSSTLCKPVIDGERLSSWRVMRNSLVRILRWFNGSRASGNGIRFQDSITAVEAIDATTRIFRMIQKSHFGAEVESQCKGISKGSKIFKLAPFLDGDGLVRCRTRLERNDELSFDEKYPIVLPGDAHAVRLFIKFCHEKKCFHVGGVAATLSQLRGKYYILSARRAVKSVLAKCKICMRFRVEAAIEQVPPLPSFRLESAPPFTMCGTDYAGPIPYRDEDNKIRKGYIVLYVCALTRAVHLELVPDMSTYEFLLSLKRFLSRFSSTTKMFSDNGANYRCAAKELKILFGHVRDPTVQQFLTDAEIRWEFSTPKAPWQAGWWERLVQCIKRPLRRILGKNSLSFRELETILMQIESMVNQRPLTAVQLDPNEVTALSPADLLFGHRAKPGLPAIDSTPQNLEAVKAIVFSQRWKYQQRVIQDFQKRFQEEYLQYLRSAHIRDPVVSRSIGVGDVCLLKDASPSRAYWPLCRVLELSGGEKTDRAKRSCLIKTAQGQIFRRPIQLLFPLEV